MSIDKEKITPACDTLTVKEAARELGVSSALVYSLCAAGKLEHERHGLRRGTIRITRDALEAYRQRNTIAECARPPLQSGNQITPRFRPLRL